jgi:hypothetical protein
LRFEIKLGLKILNFRELQDGIPVTDANGKRLGDSAIAAKSGITQVVLSRIGMAVPSMGTFSWGLFPFGCAFVATFYYAVYFQYFFFHFFYQLSKF